MGSGGIKKTTPAQSMNVSTPARSTRNRVSETESRHGRYRYLPKSGGTHDLSRSLVDGTISLVERDDDTLRTTKQKKSGVDCLEQEPRCGEISQNWRKEFEDVKKWSYSSPEGSVSLNRKSSGYDVELHHRDVVGNSNAFRRTVVENNSYSKQRTSDVFDVGPYQYGDGNCPSRPHETEPWSELRNPRSISRKGSGKRLLQRQQPHTQPSFSDAKPSSHANDRSGRPNMNSLSKIPSFRSQVSMIHEAPFDRRRPSMQSSSQRISLHSRASFNGSYQADEPDWAQQFESATHAESNYNFQKHPENVYLQDHYDNDPFEQDMQSDHHHNRSYRSSSYDEIRWSGREEHQKEMRDYHKRRSPVWSPYPAIRGTRSSCHPEECDHTQQESWTSPKNSTISPLTLEISPGVFEIVRGAKETWAAVEDGFVSFPVCFCCSTELVCIFDAQYVICATCKVVSPVSNSGSGVGLGLLSSTVNGAL